MRDVSKRNLSAIKGVVIQAGLLAEPNAKGRVVRFLKNWRAYRDPTDSRVVIHCSSKMPDEETWAKEFIAEQPAEIRDITVKVVSDKKRPFNHVMSAGKSGLAQSRKLSRAQRLTLRGSTLILWDRVSAFIKPFKGGLGTTCGTWTPVVATNVKIGKKKSVEKLQGFIEGAVTAGVCPVRCPYCYLNSEIQEADVMKVALTLEKLAEELEKWRNYPFPINFCELSGFVEYDEWFVDDNGRGSLVQTVIDACHQRNIIPFLLTKIGFPDYLEFPRDDERYAGVQVGISLLPEPVRQVFSPGGSPANELLESLRQAVQEKRAIDPVIRLGVFWEMRDSYEELFKAIAEAFPNPGVGVLKDHQGKHDVLRVTVDFLRFTPSTLREVMRRYPENTEVFLGELQANYQREGDGKIIPETITYPNKDRHKVRPTRDREAEIFGWVRSKLNANGLNYVVVTGCKGNPEEQKPLLRAKVFSSMPCACHSALWRQTKRAHYYRDQCVDHNEILYPREARSDSSRQGKARPAQGNAFPLVETPSREGQRPMTSTSSKSKSLVSAENTTLVPPFPSLESSDPEERISEALEVLEDFRKEVKGRESIWIGGFLLMNFYDNDIKRYRQDQAKKKADGVKTLKAIEEAAFELGQPMYKSSYMSKCIRLFHQVTAEIPEYRHLPIRAHLKLLSVDEAAREKGMTDHQSCQIKKKLAKTLEEALRREGIGKALPRFTSMLRKVGLNASSRGRKPEPSAVAAQKSLDGWFKVQKRRLTKGESIQGTKAEWDSLFGNIDNMRKELKALYVTFLKETE